MRAFAINRCVFSITIDKNPKPKFVLAIGISLQLGHGTCVNSRGRQTLEGIGTLILQSFSF